MIGSRCSLHDRLSAASETCTKKTQFGRKGRRPAVRGPAPPPPLKGTIASWKESTIYRMRDGPLHVKSERAPSPGGVSHRGELSSNNFLPPFSFFSLYRRALSARFPIRLFSRRAAVLSCVRRRSGHPNQSKHGSSTGAYMA